MESLLSDSVGLNNFQAPRLAFASSRRLGWSHLSLGSSERLSALIAYYVRDGLFNPVSFLDFLKPLELFSFP